MLDLVHAILWVFNSITVLAVGFSLLTLVLPCKVGRAKKCLAVLRPMLIAGILAISACAYHVFWFTFLPFWNFRPWVHAGHALMGSMFMLNVVCNYVACVRADPSMVDRSQDIGSGGSPARFCVLCERHIVNLDHHCPLTGGCIGEHNLRPFALFVLHGWLGSGYATALTWRPYCDCILAYHPDTEFDPTMPEYPEACIQLGERANLFSSALACFACLGCLGTLHMLLACNGLTTAALHKEWARHGSRALFDLCLIRSTGARCDKWSMFWGHEISRAGASRLQKLRILTLPSARPRGLGDMSSRYSSAGSSLHLDGGVHA